MRTRRTFALATAAALAASTLVGAPAAADAEDPAGELLTHEFTSGELGQWWGNDVEGRTSFPELGEETVLAIDRAADHHGIQSPHGLLAEEDLELAPGDTVVYTAQIRLHEEVEDSVEARWVAHDEGPSHNYEWGQATDVTAEEWTEVASSFEITEETDLSAFRAYTGLPDVAGLEEYTYYIRSASLVLHRTGEQGDGGDEPGEPTDPEPPVADSPQSLSHDFEDGDLGPWQPRYVSDEQHTVQVTDAQAYAGSYAAAITDRTHQGQGIGADATEALAPGQQYDLTAWVKFADGEETDELWFSAASTADGSTSYSTLAQFSGLSNTEWVQVEQRFTAPTAEELSIYFETAYSSDEAGNTATFYIDDIQVSRVEAAFDPDLHDPPLKDTVDFPLGVAIDERETTGTASAVVNHHFDRVTAENHMKPEAWYAGEGTDTFRMHPEAEAILDYAAENDLGVYGHVLVWHSQTPDWFFDVSSQADMDARMEFHIRSVAETIAEKYGPYGSDTNPVVAWDVVNEVIDDGAAADRDGMRNSNWFQAWGDETYVDRAFELAEHYFNDVHAAEGADRPVALYLNDYNTELSAKRERMIGLTDRLLERGVPVDGFAHQFHLNLSMPIENLRQAFNDVEAAFPGMPQLVTELDITIGDSPTEGLLIDQAYHYRDAFDLFREWSAQHQLDSVAVWGLNDGRSWRAAQLPLIFNDDYSPKLAYTGIIRGELAPRENRAVVFAHDEDAAADPEEYWTRLPQHTTEEGGSAFQMYWTQEGLVFSVDSAADSVSVVHEGQSYELSPDGVSLAEIDGLGQGDNFTIDFHADGDSWLNGNLTLVEALSYHEVPEAEQALELNAEFTEVWAQAPALLTETEIETGARDGASAEVYTLWEGDTLHLLADVTDPDVDVSASDPWVQDSVEFFLDLGNERNGPYRTGSREGHHLLSEQFDFQFRISAENEVSFGSGDEQFQAEQLQSATSLTEHGYIIQAAIELRGYGGANSVHGFDVQVNDSHQGTRLVTTWADPTGNGYQSTERWGALRLVDEVDGGPGEDPDPTDEPTDPGEEPTDEPTDPGEDIWPPDPEDLTEANRGEIEILTDPAVEGEDIEAFIGETSAGEEVRAWLFSEPADLGSTTADAGAVITVTLPEDSDGEHRFAVYTPEGELLGWTEITVVAADDDAAPSPTPTGEPTADPTESPAPDADEDEGADEDGLAATGATIAAVLLAALLLLGTGTLILRTSRRRTQ